MAKRKKVDESEVINVPIAIERVEKPTIQDIPLPDKFLELVSDKVVFKNNEHLVSVNGKDRWLSDYVINILMKDRANKFSFPEGSMFVQKKN